MVQSAICIYAHRSGENLTPVNNKPTSCCPEVGTTVVPYAKTAICILRSLLLLLAMAVVPKSFLPAVKILTLVKKLIYQIRTKTAHTPSPSL